MTYQLKILTTALMSVILLGKAISLVKWSALVMLTIGVSMVQLQGYDGDAVTTTTPSPLAGATGSITSNSVMGLIAVLLACCTSGLAGVYLEKMVKMSGTSIWMRNVQLGTVGTVMALLTAAGKDSERILEGGMAQGFTIREVCLVLMHSIGGLSSAAVLKYADNILKCFSGGIAIVLVSIITVLCFEGFSPGLLFVGGMTLVILATFLYNLGMPAFMEGWTNMVLNKTDGFSILAAGNTAGSSHVN